ncbi:hypothetical protein T440DRAFT_375303, partial [Plenodomus tracheiphilus IPT5]
DGADKMYVNRSDRRDPEVFQLYSQWLYTNRIAVQVHPSMKTNEKGVEEDTEKVSLSHLFRSYLLGETLADSTYQTAVIRTLIRWVRKEDTYPANLLICSVYQGTTKGSPLRKLLVDFWVWEASAEWLTDSLVEDTCAEFAQNIISALVKQRPRPTCDNSEKDLRPWIATPGIY